MKIQAQHWEQWLASPVTQAVLACNKEKRDEYLEQILNLDIPDSQKSLELYGLKSLALRYAAEGMAVCTDVEFLKLQLVEEVPDERA
jgi:hypothetical protein